MCSFYLRSMYWSENYKFKNTSSKQKKEKEKKYKTATKYKRIYAYFNDQLTFPINYNCRC